MDGQLRQHGDRWELVFTRRLPHRPDKVWRALTEPEHLAAWFPTTIEGERAPGAKLRFAFPFPDAPAIEGEMLAYDPPSHLEFRWGDETLRFDLAPDGDGCELTFLNQFDDVGKAARDAAGWHECLDLLAYRLDGTEPPWKPGEHWAEVHPRYVERFGPQASTIGPPDWHPESAGS
jgi:uncharacterized protein YndB with AHSA1/START domain